MKIIRPTFASIEISPEEKKTLQTAGNILALLSKDMELFSYEALVAEEGKKVSRYEINKNANILFGLVNDSYSIQ